MIQYVFVTLIIVMFSIVPSVSASTAEHGASASEGEVVLKTLLDGGIITQEQYDNAVEEIKKKSKEREAWRTHVDKHITLMEGAAPRFIDGLSAAAGITMVGQGTIGNDDNTAPGEDVVDGSISANLEVSASLDKYGVAFMRAEAGAGEGLQDDEIISFWGVNDSPGDGESRFEITEAWYEHRFINDMLTFTIGKINLSNYVDGNMVANDETDQFLATGFVNSITIEFPDNTIGARLTVSPTELIDLSIGWQDGTGDFEDIFEDPFIIVEVGIKPSVAGHQGNYRLYGWINSSDHTEIKNPSRTDEGGAGAGISADQQVVDGLVLFARLGFQDDDVYEVAFAWSGGVAVSGWLWGMDDDVAGIAYGQAYLSDGYKETLISPADEGHFEAYYKHTINEHITVTPDIQVISNALGDGDFNTVLAGGLRVQLIF